MGKRVALAGLLVGGGALTWWLSRQQDGGGVYAPINLDQVAAPPPPGGDVDSYLTALSAAEDPGGGLYTKNPGSSASGLFQFTKATWTGLGGDWGPDGSQAFGGLKPSAEEQWARARQLTAANAGVLGGLGLDATGPALYAVHFLGAGRASRVLPGIMSADPGTPLAQFIPSGVLALNKAVGSTVGSFLGYLTRTVGGS